MPSEGYCSGLDNPASVGIRYLCITDYCHVGRRCDCLDFWGNKSTFQKPTDSAMNCKHVNFPPDRRGPDTSWGGVAKKGLQEGLSIEAADLKKEFIISGSELCHCRGRKLQVPRTLEGEVSWPELERERKREKRDIKR